MSAKALFESRDNAELAAKYDQWSSSYESDMGDHSGPRETVEIVSKYCGLEDRILDAGCGTGLAGQLLQERGYWNLEGLDLSRGMLDQAAAKGCYAALHQGVLGEPLALPTSFYDATMVIGVFARAHAPAVSLRELVRITKPRGHVIFTIRPEFYESSDFKQVVAELGDTGSWRLVERTEPFDGRFKDFPEVCLQVWVFEVLSD